jgi:hypothetical protein
MSLDETGVVPLGIVEKDAVEFFALSGGEDLVLAEAFSRWQQSLATQHFIDPRDAAGKAVRSIEKAGEPASETRIVPFP